MICCNGPRGPISQMLLFIESGFHYIKPKILESVA
ncbi:MAG: hypothetical protein BMS9Abin28_0588 [Anaerolineae bacterium]|nr:MAG: hypothetical protein BMS9Abin28_0588 [Anaerolineae bacterium]